MKFAVWRWGRFNLREMFISPVGFTFLGKVSSSQRAKNVPLGHFINVALRPPPVADKGSINAVQNKEHHEPALRAK